MYREMTHLLMIALANLEGRQVYRFRKILEKTQWATRTELNLLQLRSLRALVKHAYETVPYYHESFTKAGFKPDHLKSLEDLRKIPVLKKEAIRNRLHDMLSQSFPKHDLILRKTSGTTALPAKLYRHTTDVAWGIAAELRGYSWAGYELGDRMGLLWSFKPSEKGRLRRMMKHVLNRTVVLNTWDISEKSISKFARRLHWLKPDYIRGYPNSTNAFATYLARRSQFRITPKAIFTTGETLRPHYRKNIEMALNSKVHEYYATTEMSHVAFQCGNHEGLHVTDENVYFETVKNGESAAGEEGQILLTNLHNYAMPLIRYEIEDSGTQLIDECSCGRKLSLMKVHGRQYELFMGSDGRFTVLRDAQFVLQNLPIEDFQIVQESLDEIVVKVARKPGYSEAHTAFIKANLSSHGPARIKVEYVDSIAPGRTGKARHLISKITTEYTRNPEQINNSQSRISHQEKEKGKWSTSS